MRQDAVERDDVPRRVLRLEDRALDRLLEVEHQVARVAAEELVAALAAEDDRHALARGPRDDELRVDARARRGLVEVPDDVAERAREVVGRALDEVVLGADVLRDRGRIRSLVEVATLAEPAGERG